MKTHMLFGVCICLLLVGTFLVVTPVTVSADLVDGDYTYTVGGDGATVTGYTGNGSAIVIPSTLGGYPTVYIGENAFSSNLNLTSVGIPTSVLSIGDGAFDSCSNLITVLIPGSVTSIGVYAFVSCISLSSVTLPGSLSIIGDGAFASCSSLSSINIPSSVTTIGAGAFAYCSNLTVITVATANIHYASDQGILYNKAKTTVIQCPAGKTGAVSIPGSVITIGVASFISCSSLTSVTIPDSVLSIEYNAFASCTSLSSVSVGQSVRTIGKNAFLSCSSLTSISIPASVITIGDSAFSNCPLSVVSIPDSVSTIGFFTFSACPLVSVIIGRGVTTIGNYAFASCVSLINITFLGLVAPTYVGASWIFNTPAAIRGHASASSDFPTPGEVWNGLTMGAYVSMNHPPVFGTQSPANDSTGNPLSLTWSIPVSDPDGDRFHWWIQCSNGQSTSATGASNGTKSVPLSELSYATTYMVWVNATDPTGSNLYTRRWYRFTTRISGNNPPVFHSAPTPENASTGNPLSLIWSISIDDLEGNPFNWTLHCSNGQTASGTKETNGTKSLPLSGLTYATTYTVWVNATDPNGSGTYTRRWFLFTTRYDGSQPPGPPGPSNIEPIADASAGEPYHGFVNATILFNGSHSSDPDGTITLWLWGFGDNTTGTGITVTHVFTQPGTYNITLTVFDNEGATHTTITTCRITQHNMPPVTPVIIGPTNGTAKTTYAYTTIATDPDNDTIYYSIIWGDETSYMNTSGFLPSGTPFTCSHRFTTAGLYIIRITASDNHTASQPASHPVLIDGIYVRDLGCLLDQTGDSVYDTFYSNQTMHQTSVQRLKNGTYLFDIDGDDTLDYMYNPITSDLSEYHPLTPGFELLVLIGAIVVSFLLWDKKMKR